jgi:hypothetical protein
MNQPGTKSNSATPKWARAVTLQTASSGVLIVAHNEDTTNLKQTLIEEGFRVDEVRGPYTQEQLRYSAIMRCLVNHANAWRIAVRRERPTIIVEADFVPVKGFGGLPVPIPSEKCNNSVAYLYSVGPQIWDLAGSRCARGHGGGMVALFVPPNVASLLLEFFNEEVHAVPVGAYSPFDTKVGYWLNARGVESYIPYRHYGEHGGIGNPEHAAMGLRRPHQADTLQGKLAFLPTYAKRNVLRYWKTRVRARLWGIFRLMSGRYLAWPDFRRADAISMVRFAVGRYFLIKPPVS